MPNAGDAERLENQVANAVASRVSAQELIPVLAELLDQAAPGSELAVDMHLQLAELRVETEPWKAALHAKSVLKDRDDEHAWAVLGLAHSLLKSYKSARRAYTEALRLAPDCPSYSHNLGHLLDVMFGEPALAIEHLRRAHRLAPAEPEIAASLAHALLRSGYRPEALSTLAAAIDNPVRAEKLLNEWEAAPARPSAAAPLALNPKQS